MRKSRSKGRSTPAKPVAAPRFRADLLILGALFLAAFVVYAPVRNFDFVNFDDPDYVTANAHVRHGITLDSLKWALTSTEAANWFPVTRISHLVDCQLFGLQPGWHHLTNVLFHALATLLLFAFLHRATGAVWRSAFVAFVFALHPLHVESVAWISERKDVLSAFFGFLALWAYTRYAERPAAGRYVLVLAAFALGLMSKPMLVTLPLLLLLLDVWPLGRGLRLREKIPFFALSAASAIATYVTQHGSGAVQTLGALPVTLRVENAVVSFAVYLAKTLWPSGLAVFYPYPADVPAWQIAVAVLILAGISSLAWRSVRTHPYFAVGWLWFVVTLLPVIGLIQVGAQARADRYMYIPMVGLTIMLAWGAADVLRNRHVLMALGGVACLASSAVAWGQVQHWRNSETLFTHALEVTGGNYLAHHNLGVALTDQPGRLPDAIAHLQDAVRIQPNSARSHTDLGTALAKMPGRLPEAIAEYHAALRIEPTSAIPHNNLGSALTKAPGRLPEAIAELEIALRLDPDNPQIHDNLGYAFTKAGRLPEALAQAHTALGIDPDSPKSHNTLGGALAEMPGRLPEAISEYETALRLKPDYADAHNNLGAAMADLPGRLPEAIVHYEAALRLQPDFVEAHNNLGTALASIPNRLPEAIAHYEAAARLAPDNADVQYNLGAALSRIEGRTPEAITHLETALRLRPDYAEAHNNLGVVLSSIPGRLPEAIAHFQAALRIRPDYEDARANLAIARGSQR